MGVLFMGGMSKLQRDHRIHYRPKAGRVGAPMLGVIFGLGWAPWIGPTNSAVLLLSSAGSPSPVRGGILAFVYCLGLGLPFIFIALGFTNFMGAMSFFRKHQRLMMRLGGGLLILVGLLMVSGIWNLWVIELQTWFANAVRLPI